MKSPPPLLKSISTSPENAFFYNQFSTTPPTLTLNKMQHIVITKLLTNSTWNATQIYPPTHNTFQPLNPPSPKKLLPKNTFYIYRQPNPESTHIIILHHDRITLTQPITGTPDLTGITSYINQEANTQYRPDQQTVGYFYGADTWHF